jgi:hypothetical protein
MVEKGKQEVLSRRWCVAMLVDTGTSGQRVHLAGGQGVSAGVVFGIEKTDFVGGDKLV